MVAAAEARLVTGETSAARALLDRAAPELPDPVVSARARRLGGDILFAAGESAAATSVLAEAARMVAPYDARPAMPCWTRSRQASLSQHGAGTAEVVQALRSAPGVTDSQATTGDLLLDGFAAVAERRFAEARLLRQAVGAVTGGQPVPGDAPQRFLAFRLAATELDDSAWRELAGQWVARARDQGALAALVVGPRVPGVQPAG